MPKGRIKQASIIVNYSRLSPATVVGFVVGKKNDQTEYLNKNSRLQIRFDALFNHLHLCRNSTDWINSLSCRDLFKVCKETADRVERQRFIQYRRMAHVRDFHDLQAGIPLLYLPKSVHAQHIRQGAAD